MAGKDYYSYIVGPEEYLREGLAGSESTPAVRIPFRSDLYAPRANSAGARKSPAPITGANIHSSTLAAGSTSSSTEVPEVPSVEPPKAGPGAEPPDRTFAEGPSRPIANITAIGNLALGLAGYFEDRKTAGLQRDSLKHNIATAKEHSANRRALGASWANAWS